MGRISSIQDVDHFYDFLKETGQANSNQSKREYLDRVNSTPELYDRYAPGDRAQKEANLGHNLGSNWRDFYDYDTGKYKPGFDIQKHNEGRIGIYNETGEDIGARGGKRTSSSSSYNSGGMYREYQAMVEEMRKLREQQFAKSKEQLEKEAENASRQAYVMKQQTMLGLPQQNALMGQGGLSESSKLNLDLNYQNQMNKIQGAKQDGLLELEQQKQNALDADIAQAQKRLEAALEQQRAQQERRRQALENASKNQGTTGKTKSTTEPTASQQEQTALASSLRMMGYTDREIQEYFQTR